MQLGLVALRKPPCFRNQIHLIAAVARKEGWDVIEKTVDQTFSYPKERFDRLIALIPLWPRYLMHMTRLTAPWFSKSHVIYGPVDGPYQKNISLFQIMRKMNLAAPSQWCADCIGKSAGVSVEVVPHGINHKDFKFSQERVKAQRRLWVGEDKDKTVFFSNLTPIHRKGFQHLCRALGILHDRLGDTFILVLHTKLDKAKRYCPDIEKTPGLVIEDTYGGLPFRAVALKTRACDVYVHPSLNEGFGLTILEAMAAKRTIVCLDAPAMNELVSSKEAWLFPMTEMREERLKNGALAHLHEYDPASLAEAMLKAMTKKKVSREKAVAAYEKSLAYDYMKVYPTLLKL